MSEDLVDETRRLAVETAVFKRLDKRREEKSAKYAVNQNARDEQNAGTIAILAEIDSWTSRLSETMSEKVANKGAGDEVVERTVFLDNLAEDIQKLDAHFAEKSSYIAAYDVKRIQSTILELHSRFQELQEELQPKKKFGFKGKKKKETVSSNREKKTETSKPSNFQTDGFQVADVTGATLEISRADASSRDVLLSRLKGCVVKILCSPTTVHMADLEDCKIVCGPVRTSAFVERCKKCTFVVACQQLRTHETTDSDFYLHVTSKGIIEDCHRVRFAPYDFRYDNTDLDFGESGLSSDVNNWDKIDDFNWLSLDQASPNWSLLPEAERRKDWD